MKKEMFNNRYGLNTAVLEDRKTQTRRLSGLYDQTMNPHLTLLLRSEKGREEFIAKKSRYKIGEVVAIAQSYRDCAEECKVKLNRKGWRKMLVDDEFNFEKYEYRILQEPQDPQDRS